MPQIQSRASDGRADPRPSRATATALFATSPGSPAPFGTARVDVVDAGNDARLTTTARVVATLPAEAPS